VIDWRFDNSDDEEFDKGFERFVKERKIKVYKKGEIPSPLGFHLEQGGSLEQE
jgi:hypothetical protein